MRILKIVGWALVLLVAVLALAATIVPPFLDRIYYRGPVTNHYDGQHFVNPDGADDTVAPPTGGSRAGFFWRYLTASDGRPAWPANVTVARVVPAARVAALADPDARFCGPPEAWGGFVQNPCRKADPMIVTWIGHASVLIQTQGLNILTDPVWSDTAGPWGFGPRRVAAPGIAFEQLPKIDVVLISHDHYDHMDLPTLRRLWRRDHPKVITSLGNDSVVRQAGVPAVARDWGGSVAVAPGVDVIVTRNHHWGSRWFTDRNRALWSSFVIVLPGGNVFFAGDTGMGDGKWPEEARRYGPIRLALLPIGAFRFGEGQMGIGSHVGPVDAVDIYRRLGAARALAIHWGTFRLSYEAWDTPPRLLAAAQACTGQDGFGTAPIGRPVTVPAYTSPKPVAAMPRAALLACLDTPAVKALR